jgi:hypothetical protein
MSFVCIVAYTWSSVRIHEIQSLTFLYDHFLGLTFAAFVWSVILTTGCMSYPSVGRTRRCLQKAGILEIGSMMYGPDIRD